MTRTSFAEKRPVYLHQPLQGRAIKITSPKFQVTHYNRVNTMATPLTQLGEIMAKQTQQQTRTQQQLNDRANALNNNRGTSGTNPVNAQVHGNRGKQLNPNQK